MLAPLPHKQERKDDVAYAARYPYGNEKEKEDSQPGKKAQDGPPGHQDVEQRRPRTQQNVPAVRELCLRPEIRYRDPHNSQGIDQPPFFNKPYMNMPVRHLEEGLPQVWNQRVAQRGYAHGADVTNGQQDPDVASLFLNRAFMELVHGSGYERAQYDMEGM